MKISMPQGKSYGWGIAGRYLAQELSSFPPLEGVTLHCVSGHDFAPFDETEWNRINIGYCFFEDEIVAYRHLPDAIRRWDFIVAGSRWCEHHLCIGGMERTTTILQGIDTNIFRPTPPLQDQNRFIVFSGGKFEFRKGHDIVIAAMRTFMARHNDVWLAAAWHNHWPQSIQTMEQTRLIDFTYHDAPCHELYLQLLARNGIDLKRVILYPQLDNSLMPDRYAKSHVGLFPNRCEGGNNMVMCEYMACGRTVVASARTGHADVITTDNALSLTRYEPVLARTGGKESGVWFEVAVDEVVELLEQAYMDSSLLQRKAKVAAEDMQRLSWSEAAMKFYAIAQTYFQKYPVLIQQHNTIAGRFDEALKKFSNGDFEGAEEIYRRLIVELPLNPDIHNSLATALDSQKRYREAIAYYTKAILLKPDFAVALFNLANTLKKVGDLEGCRLNLIKVLEVDPDFVLAWQNLATIYFDQGNLEEAIKCLEHVLTLDPESVVAWAELGELYYQIGNEDKRALTCFEQVIANKPNFAAAYNSKGLILHELGDYAGAERCYRAALSLEADDPHYLSNLGLSLQALGKPDEAISCFNRSLELESSATTRFNRGMSLLSIGELQQGWIDYECRFDKIDPVCLAPLDVPRWGGEDLSGKTILVRLEQGYGDCIQCMRFLPKLNARVIVECMDEKIRSLFRQFPGVSETCLRGENPPPAHFQVPIFSLPLMLGVQLNTIPFRNGYLTVDERLTGFWQERITTVNSTGCIAVGIVWGGRKSRLNANRSMQLNDFDPLLQLSGFKWFSLQVGDDAQQLERLRDRVEDLAGDFVTFADTAAAIRNLDLVITVDTSVAHLCGALGKTAFVLLKSAPDWRWMLGRDDSPWYHSLQLFRQQQPGNWQSVVSAVQKKLEAACTTKKRC